MIKKNNENKTLFLNSGVAKKLGINNLEEQEVYLNNQKLNVHVIDNVAEEYYLNEPYNRANRYLEVGGVTYDNFAVSKTLISSLNDYQIMVHQKTRNYLIDKKFWTKEGLEAFVGEEYFFNDLSREEIEEKNTLYNLWIQEREFNTNRVSKEIYTLSKKQAFLNESSFLDKKSTIESNLDIIQILIYLKSLLLKTASQKNIILNTDSFDFSKFNVSELEYLPFSFQKSDYEKRRNFINNSKQLIDGSIDYDLIEYNENDENDSYSESSLQSSFVSSNELNQELTSKQPIKIAELKPFEDTKLTLEEVEKLEKEFYSAGEINVFDDKDETEHNQLVDIDHVNDDKYNEVFTSHIHHEEKVIETITQTTITSSQDVKILDLKVGKLLERKYRRHHESPMMVDIENKVDFLMAGYEALENDDPEVLERDRQLTVDPDDLPIKELKRKSKKEIKNKESNFEEVSELSQVKTRLDEINELHLVQEQEIQSKPIDEVLVEEEKLDLQTENNFESKKSKKEKKKRKGLFSKKEVNINELVVENQPELQQEEVLVVEEQKTQLEEIVEPNNFVNETKEEVSITQNIVEENKVDENLVLDVPSYEPKVEETLDDLDPFKSMNFENENYNLVDLSDKIKLDSEDFEAKTQEVNDKTLELINELSEEKSKKKKKGWLFSKKNKE